MSQLISSVGLIDGSDIGIILYIDFNNKRKRGKWNKIFKSILNDLNINIINQWYSEYNYEDIGGDELPNGVIKNQYCINYKFKSIEDRCNFHHKVREIRYG